MIGGRFAPLWICFHHVLTRADRSGCGSCGEAVHGGAEEGQLDEHGLRVGPAGPAADKEVVDGAGDRSLLLPGPARVLRGQLLHFPRTLRTAARGRAPQGHARTPQMMITEILLLSHVILMQFIQNLEQSIYSSLFLSALTSTTASVNNGGTTSNTLLNRDTFHRRQNMHTG